uniref:Uncharacterized protein n=1 Tax=Tanacetum cinerariifolium TaxID=118510 RepID=A0A6L2M7A0_TANCI|nr:hypothetical protein [Tanacetum cinerariifolium]
MFVPCARAEAASRVNILNFCEKDYEDILSVIDKIRLDKRKEFHTRKTPDAGRLRNNDGNVFSRLGHQRTSEFKRPSDTYSPSMTKSGSDREYSRDVSYSRGRPHKRDSSPSRDQPRSKYHSYGIEESMKRGRNSESSLSHVSESGTSEGGHWKSKSKRHKPTDEEDLAVPWSCEKVDPFTP